MKKLIRAGVVGLALYGAYSLYKMYDMKKSIRNIIDDWDDEMGYPDDTEDNPNKDQADDWNLGTKRDEDLFNVESDYSGKFKTDFNAFETPSDNVFNGSIFDNSGVEDDLDDNWDLDSDPDDTDYLVSDPDLEAEMNKCMSYPDLDEGIDEEQPIKEDTENWNLDLDDEIEDDKYIKEDLSFETNDDYIEDEEEF